MINGIDEIFLTKLDVLDEFDEIKVVTAYLHDGGKNEVFEPSINYLEKVKPLLKFFPGWKRTISVSEIKNFNALPGEARNYIEFIENFINVPIRYISVGTNRNQTLSR
jgi:adenylosuccinate synthase